MPIQTQSFKLFSKNLTKKPAHSWHTLSVHTVTVYIHRQVEQKHD